MTALRRAIGFVDGDSTLATHNAVDFRGLQGGPVGGLHAREPIHAGLVYLVSHFPMTPARQKELFSNAMAELASMPDLINQALEVTDEISGEVRLTDLQHPDLKIKQPLP